MNKKKTVRMLLEIIQSLPLQNIPTVGKDLDKEEFHKLPEVAAVITLLKFLKVDRQWLSSRGFVPASMLLGTAL